MGSVIALLQAQEFGATRFAAQFVILARKAQRSFHTIRPTGGKERTAHSIGFKEFVQLISQLNRNVIGCATKCGIVRQLIQLRSHGVFDWLAGVT